MYQRLKECKTLKEIFTILGTKPFEKAAYVLLILWCILPLYSAIQHFYWGIVGVNDMQKNYALTEGYKLAVQFVGSLSVYFAVFFLIGRVSVYGKDIIKKLKKEPWHIFLLLMLLWSCISTVLSDDIYTSYHGTAYRFDGLKTYFYYAGAYVCAYIVIKDKYRKVVQNIFVLVANIVAAILILQENGVLFVTQGFLDERASVFFHYNHAGYYLNLSIVCLIGLYLYETKRWIRILYVGCMVLQICSLLINNTTGGYVAACGAMIMCLVFFVRSQGKLAWRMLTPVLILFALSAASYIGMLPNSSGEDMKVNMETMIRDAKDIMDNPETAIHAGHDRMQLWQAGIKMIPERPIFGYGPEQLNKEYAATIWVDRVANEFLQYTIFIGIPGALFYLIALVSLFVYQLIHLKLLSKGTLISAGCVIAYLISSLVGNTMFYTTPYFFIFLAFAAERIRKNSE